MTLKDLREAAGLHQKQVAKKLNITETAVSNWELGKNNILRKHHKRLAKLYGVTADELEAAIEASRKRTG